MKKYYLITLFLLLCIPVAFAQKNLNPTESFIVKGKVKQELHINQQDLKQYPARTLRSIRITNHTGEHRGTLKKVSVVPLRSLLEKIEINEDSPKLLSEYYLVAEASDGYKVVYSWNELFNTPQGEHVYIIVGMNNQNQNQLPERIALITPGDIRTGRRYVKNLSSITIRRAE